MKRILFIFALIGLISCSNKNESSAVLNGLKGNVKSVKTICYEATERFGEPTKEDIMDSWDSDGILSIYPAMLVEYDQKGNDIKHTYYDEDGDINILAKREFMGNNLITEYVYDSDGKLFSSYKVILENGKPVHIEYGPNDSGSNKKIEYEMNGFRVLSSKTYIDGELEDTSENYWEDNQLTESVTKDTEGNIIWQQIYTRNDYGQVTCEQTYREGECKVKINNEYNENHLLVRHTREGDWYDDTEYRFNYTQYDDKGNWTQRVIYLDDEIIIIQEREISYY